MIQRFWQRPSMIWFGLTQTVQVKQTTVMVDPAKTPVLMKVLTFIDGKTRDFSLTQKVSRVNTLSTTPSGACLSQSSLDRFL